MAFHHIKVGEACYHKLDDYYIVISSEVNATDSAVIIKVEVVV